MTTGLLERAVHDLEQGWPEAAVDALGGAIRVSEAARWEAAEQRSAALEERLTRFVHATAVIVADLAARVQALEKQATKTPLAELNEYRRGDSQRLDEAIKAILAKPFPKWRSPDWPTAKEVWKALRADAFYPLPKLRTVRLHLLKVRGKRQHTVMSHSDACASSAPGMIQPID